MIQFNLLPDVKLEYVRAQRTKHTVVSAAFIAVGSTLLIFTLLFMTVNVVQKKNMHDLSGDIKQYTQELKDTTDLPKILTIQNQLNALSGLHAGKPTASRTFTFIHQLIPANVSLTQLDADYVAHTIKFEGQTTGLDNLNTLVDTLKFTTYNTNVVTTKKAFSDVAVAQFTRNPTTTTFTVTASFDPLIFDNKTEIFLVVPHQVSTTSVVEQPQNIFKKATNGSGQ